jgi:hypothetical protein
MQPQSYTENKVMRPVGLATKDHCAGEDQKKYNISVGPSVCTYVLHAIGHYISHRHKGEPEENRGKHL